MGVGGITMLKTKEVQLAVAPRLRKYYESKGYDISQKNIIVKIEELVDQFQSKRTSTKQ